MNIRSYLLEIAEGRRKIRVFEAGEGRPLVFLHGAGGLTEDSPFLAALARRWHVFAPLLPGYGDSEGAEDLRDMLAVTLHSFDVLDALGVDRPILVGHSMGGMIAAEMAAVAPREVERLGLIAPAGRWLDAHPVPDLFSKLPHELPALLFHDPAFGARDNDRRRRSRRSEIPRGVHHPQHAPAGDGGETAVPDPRPWPRRAPLPHPRQDRADLGRQRPGGPAGSWRRVLPKASRMRS